MKAPSSLAEQFEELGFIVIKNLLSEEEVKNYKTKLQRLSGLTDRDFNEQRARKKGWSMADGVTRLEDWWPLIFHKR